VTGDPRPTVDWSRDDWRPITARDRARQYVDADGSDVLELDDAGCCDAGEFTVTGVNEWGSCTATASLVVETTKDDRPPVLEDMYAILTCSTERGHNFQVFQAVFCGKFFESQSVFIRTLALLEYSLRSSGLAGPGCIINASWWHRPTW